MCELVPPSIGPAIPDAFRAGGDAGAGPLRPIDAKTRSVRFVAPSCAEPSGGCDERNEKERVQDRLTSHDTSSGQRA